jgi:hypothetical protein
LLPFLSTLYGFVLSEMDDNSIGIMILPFIAIAAILADEMGLGKTIQVL